MNFSFPLFCVSCGTDYNATERQRQCVLPNHQRRYDRNKRRRAEFCGEATNEYSLCEWHDPRAKGIPFPFWRTTDRGASRPFRPGASTSSTSRCTLCSWWSGCGWKVGPTQKGEMQMPMQLPGTFLVPSTATTPTTGEQEQVQEPPSSSEPTTTPMKVSTTNSLTHLSLVVIL